MASDLQSDRDRSRRADRGGRTRFSDDRDRSHDGGDRASCRRIYVSNVPYEYRWQDLKDLFRKEVGDVSFVELFNDENNKPRGCGIVEFEKAEHVQAALEKMNRYDINGRNLVIKEDYGNERDKFGRVVPKGGPGGGGVGGGGRGGNDFGGRGLRDDDRMSGVQGIMGNDFSGFETYGLSIKFLEGLGIQPPLHTKVFVANLDYKVDAKKLKQIFKMAGRIQELDLSLDKDGNSRGFATIVYDHPVEAVQAISMFDRQNLYERRMTVRLDRISEKNDTNRLPEGLKGIGIGLGPNGEPLKDVARNLPSLQNQGNSNANSQSISNVAPTPVAAPAGSILGPVPNANLSALSGNLAAQLSNVVGLSNLAGNLPTSLLTNAAASLSSLGGLTGLTGNTDSGNAGFNQNYQSGGGFGGSNRSGSDFDMGSSNVRNYSTQPNDDYGRSYGGNNMNNGARGKSSDTIVIRNIPSTWTWQTLRDKFRDVGEVKFAEIRGQDTGVVRFAKERDAEVAINLMDGSRFDGRTVDVTFF